MAFSTDALNPFGEIGTDRPQLNQLKISGGVMAALVIVGMVILFKVA